MADAYVLPLETLRMTDVGSVGGKNASLGELISQLSAAACGSRRLRHHRAAFTDFLEANGLKAKNRPGPREAQRRGRGHAREERARDPRMGGRDPVPAELERQIREAYARVAGNGEASFAVRSSATPRTCRMPPSPASRRPSSTSARGERAGGREAGLRLPLQRPRHLLPRAQGLRPCGRGAVAGIQRMCVPTPAPRASSSRWTPSRASATWCS